MSSQPPCIVDSVCDYQIRKQKPGELGAEPGCELKSAWFQSTLPSHPDSCSFARSPPSRLLLPSPALPLGPSRVFYPVLSSLPLSVSFSLASCLTASSASQCRELLKSKDLNLQHAASPTLQPPALTAPRVAKPRRGQRAPCLPCSAEPQTRPGSLAGHTPSPSGAGFSSEPHQARPLLSVPVGTASPRLSWVSKPLTSLLLDSSLSFPHPC